MSYHELASKLDALGLDGKVIGDEYTCACVFHGSSGGRNDHNFGINLRKGVYVCWSGKCGKSGTLNSLFRYLGISFNYDIPDSFEDEKEEDEYKLPDIKELENWNFVHPYLLDRGFKKETLIKNGIGYNKSDYRITIPVFSNGIYYGAVQRTVLPDVIDRYKNPKGFPKQLFVYSPLSEGEGDVVVVEGPLNALMACQRGDDGKSTFGSKISKSHVNQIVEYAREKKKRIVLFFDPDDSGIEATEKFISYYKGDNLFIAKNPTKKDVVELTDEEYSDIIKNAESYLDRLLEV